MIHKTKITVVGSGYEGMSLAVFLAQHDDVVVLDEQLAFQGSIFGVVVTLTNYDPDTNRFDNSSVKSIITGVVACQK